MKDLEAHVSELIKDSSPKGSKPAPVELWNPELSGNIDIVVKRDGRWFHEGSEIKRKEIVKIFCNILKLENDEYFLVTPVEKWRIQVEDAPFLVVSLESIETEEGAALQLTTKTGESFVLGSDHHLEVEYKAGIDGEPSPYALVRTNLKALIARNVFYQLVELADVEEESGKSYMVVYSQGQRFVLGQC
ncbi:DUF1285 domain-containing protein [Litoribrevibacter albus]|uniref:DUF1285 domain-containing protein n=1 Tax=Litoribrevibacter albus TaxID=1473156 RepID=A0AA37SBN4_9GAMM|nr:DUF1285 domain-containing protein [Litoribrevibacter albus]GLQ31714.1 hypothetical protein GCM10007876_21930 [Litoribrevibacter albus]